MQRGSKAILSLVLWNLLVGISAVDLSEGVLSAQASATAQSNGQTEIEKGRQAVGQVCVTCHTNILRMVQVHKQSPEQWKDTVYSMIGRGAQVMPDEIEPVIAFLAANPGTNRDTVTQISRGRRAESAKPDSQTPEGEGRVILQQRCQQCHDLATASTKLASEDWDTTIAKMMIYGAKLTPADKTALIGYLNGLAK